MSECGCVYSDGGEYGPEFYCTTTPKARKAHPCCECGESIAIGRSYYREAGTWEGEMNAYKTCAECYEIRKALFCDGWIYTHMWADIEQQLFPTMAIGCLEKMATAAAKQKLMDRWRQWQVSR